jgi:hypothetical protein
MGANDPTYGGWLPIDRAAKEIARDKAEREEALPPAPAKQPKPEVTPSPGAAADDFVDEFYVEKIAREKLPKAEDYAEYARLAGEGVIRGIAARVIERAGYDLGAFARKIEAADAALAEAEIALNTKQAPPAAPGDGQVWPGLPGVTPDPVCTSQFDVKDLALTGRKAVTVRRYEQPVIFPDVLIAVSGAWRFGQRMEFSQEWRHAGFTLGDLSTSLSLLPGEELTVEVSSWQRNKTEIASESEQTVKRSLENEQRSSDERACTNAAASAFGYSVTATGSVTYPVASASVSASVSGSSSEQMEHSSRAIKESTTKAVCEVSSRRAIKCTQTSEFGSESTTTRRIRNPSACHTVTFNFFQVVKLYDVQLRLSGNNPLLVLPGIFPRFYGPLEVRRGETGRPTEVDIPFHLIEDWASPAVFLTAYFDVDRMFSRLMNGIALRARFEHSDPPEAAARRFAEGLVVACKFLLRQDPEQQVAPLAALLKNYLENILAQRERSAATYGPGKGRPEELNTPGIYVDALRGRCSACDDQSHSSAYVDVLARHEEMLRQRAENALVGAELKRREALLEKGDLAPFEPPPILVGGAQPAPGG